MSERIEHYGMAEAAEDVSIQRDVESAIASTERALGELSRDRSARERAGADAEGSLVRALANLQRVLDGFYCRTGIRPLCFANSGDALLERVADAVQRMGLPFNEAAAREGIRIGRRLNAEMLVGRPAPMRPVVVEVEQGGPSDDNLPDVTAMEGGGVIVMHRCTDSLDGCGKTPCVAPRDERKPED